MTEPWEPVEHGERVEMLRALGHAWDLSVFVETGTAYGVTLERLAHDFDELHSIELNEPHHRAALERLANHPHIHLLLGDSSELLSSVISSVPTPALVYLDGHYSGPGTAKGQLDTPIRRELDSVLDHPLPHVVVIDDARGFGVWDDYPSAQWVDRRAADSGYRCTLELDAFVLTPAT